MRPIGELRSRSRRVRGLVHAGAASRGAGNEALAGGELASGVKLGAGRELDRRKALFAVRARHWHVQHLWLLSHGAIRHLRKTLALHLRLLPLRRVEHWSLHHQHVDLQQVAEMKPACSEKHCLVAPKCNV